MTNSLVSAAHTPLFLASVLSAAEAKLALVGGADVIDIKDATLGALGAASLEESARIVQAVKAHTPHTPRMPHTPISITVGDLPMHAETLAKACMQRAALGVSYVKLGLQPASSRESCIEALATLRLPQGVEMVAVLFADQEVITQEVLGQLAQAGFAGVVIDTFDKQRGGLLQHASPHTLQACITQAKSAGLFIGLAGSLRVADIDALAALKPTLLGFRGALCVQANRAGELELERVKAVRRAMLNSLVTTTAPHSPRASLHELAA